MKFWDRTLWRPFTIENDVGMVVYFNDWVSEIYSDNCGDQVYDLVRDLQLNQ